jgi:hypothetical protein
MALAPADFYAYSQATGTAYPESPEEKAQLAQEVQEFRRNQLKAPQQESNLPGILGAAAAGLGILGAGALAARKLGRGRSQVAPSKQPPVSAASIPNVQEASSAGRVRKAEEITRQARAERPQGVVQTDLNQRGLEDFIRSSPAFGRVPAAEPVTQGPVKLLPPARTTRPNFLETQVTSPSYVQESLSNRVAEQMAGDLIDEVNAFTNPAARSELAKQQASIQGQERKDLWRLVGEIQNETLVDKQQVMRPAAIDQTANALGSSEDQMTGRMKNALQRNEDVDMSRVEWAEDLIESERQLMMEQAEPSQMIGYEADNAINEVATRLPDGLPVDQAEGIETSAQKFADTQVQRQKRSREDLLDIEYKMYDMVAGAAEQGVKMEPERALAILTNPTIELNQDELSLFKVNPDIGKFALKTQTYEPGQRQTGAAVSILGDRLKSIPNIGSDPQSPIKQAASGTSIRGRSRIQNEPEQFRQRVSSSGRPLESDYIDIDEGGTVTVYPGQELQELELNQQTDPRYIRRIVNQSTGELTQEYAPKNMRAIHTVEGKTYFVPTTDPGGIGIHGEERSYASGPLVKFDDPEQERIAGQYTKSAMRRPTDLPFVEKQQGGSRFSALSNQQLESFIQNAPEGSIRSAGQQEQMRRQVSSQSLQASQALRRAKIEGRDSNMVLRQLGFDI